MNTGFGLPLSLTTGLSFNEIAGQRAVFPCPRGDESCTGDTTTPCHEGYDGPLCSYCAAGWSRAGLAGECEECEEFMAAVWVVLGGTFILGLVTATLYFVGGVEPHHGKMTVAITIGKIVIGLIQILTQLEFTLELRWPGIFGWLIHLLKIFSFDIFGFLDIGCLTSYNYYGKFSLALAMIPVLLGVTYTLYKLREAVPGMLNRCTKMALVAIFLSYPFVSTTMFQGFSCFDLDEDESWLTIDFQISCNSGTYIAFISVGAIGVVAVPVGIPCATLYLLHKNRVAIQGGADQAGELGDTFRQFHFLVADYKPQFYYWDCLEMLRKVTITGLLIFVSKGSLFQLVVAIILCLCFMAASAWYQPYEVAIANVAKVAVEIGLLITLALCVMVKVDLSKEDVSVDFIAALMCFTIVVIPTFAIGIAFKMFGIEAQQTHTQIRETNSADAATDELIQQITRDIKEATSAESTTDEVDAAASHSVDPERMQIMADKIVKQAVEVAVAKTKADFEAAALLKEQTERKAAAEAEKQAKKDAAAKKKADAKAKKRSKDDAAWADIVGLDEDNMAGQRFSNPLHPNASGAENENTSQELQL